jgi:hypothetical protein
MIKLASPQVQGCITTLDQELSIQHHEPGHLGDGIRYGIGCEHTIAM